MAAPNKDIASQTVLRYQEIIDGVMARVKPEFAQEGIDESVLDEVRALWEAKLVATGVIGQPSNEGQQVIQQQQLHQPPRAGMPAVAGRPGSQPLTVQQQHQLLAMRRAMPGMMQPQMGMPQQMTMGGMGTQQQQQQQQQQQINMLAMMQAHAMQAQAKGAAAAAAAAAAEQKRKLEEGDSGAPQTKQPRTIPQQDGPADDAGEAAEEEGGAGAAADNGEEEEEDDDDPLTEDDGDGSGDEVDEGAIKDVALGQFEKVQRSKSKWKIVLKDCILTLNGRDYLVRRCQGEMDF